MEVRFRTLRLKRQYEHGKEAIKVYGAKAGRRYVQRIDLIQQVRSLDELKKLPALHCHELKGNRKGQWAVNLDEFYRLIFTLAGDRLEVVLVEEVSKHYDD